MEKYESNSHSAKRLQDETDKKVSEPVVKSPVKKKKKSELKKLIDLFIAEDREDIGEYVIMDVLIPGIKNTILDMLRMMFFGDRGSGGKSSTSSRISYRNYYDSNSKQKESKPILGYSYDDVVLNNRGEAEEVLARMDELISSYGVASVADFYDLVNVSGNYTDNKYGWTDIRNASVVRVRDGYVIKFPKALPIT